MVIVFQLDKYYATEPSRVKNEKKIIKSIEGPEESPNQNQKMQMSG